MRGLTRGRAGKGFICRAERSGRRGMIVRAYPMFRQELLEKAVLELVA